MGGARAITTRVLAGAASLAVFLSFSSTARAADADLDARMKALDERIDKLERVVDERNTEIARLREALRRHSKHDAARTIARDILHMAQDQELP